MNESHYPPSPSYYRRGNIDARDLVTPPYWTDSALVHLMRAGRKDGEPFADAVRNAFVCLALWFRSQSLPVPFYSDALEAGREEVRKAGTTACDWMAKANDFRRENERLQSRIAELEAAALTAVESRPVAPALDPLAGLLEVSDDVALEAWLTDRYGEPVSDQLDCGVGSATIRRWHDADRNLACATWFHEWQKWQVSTRGGNVDAPTAARTLHRILTGAAP